MTDTLTEIGPINYDMLGEYAQASTGRDLLQDGLYNLRMQDSFADDAFAVKADKAGVGYLQITMSPTIEGGQGDGQILKYFRVTTQLKDKWEGGKVVGKEFASDALDLLKNLNPTLEKSQLPTTVEEWKTAIRQLTNQLVSNVKLEANGYDKKATGKAKYLRSSDFTSLKGEDGRVSRPSFVVRTDAATGEEYKVYGNMGLAKRGFYPRG